MIAPSTHRVGLATLFTHEIEGINNLTCHSKGAYCQRWGHHYLEHEGLLDVNRPHAWSKILWIKQNLSKHDWIWWLDADAMIMNPDVSLDDILDDEHDLIIARESAPSLLGCHFLNTGSFFIRNTAWSHELLDRIYAQEDFIHHYCWEQAAFHHLYLTDCEIRTHTRVDDFRQFNSFADSYRKGDFVFHALHPGRTEKHKFHLIQKILADDASIDFQEEPNITLVLLLRDETVDLTKGHSLSSLVDDRKIAPLSAVKFMDLRQDGFSDTNGWVDAHRNWFVALQSCLETHPDEVLMIVDCPVQFFSSWQRNLLVQLSKADLLVSQTSGAPDFRVILSRNSRRTIGLLKALQSGFEKLPHDLRQEKNCLQTFLLEESPLILEHLGIQTTLMSLPTVWQTAAKPNVLEVSGVCLQISDIHSQNEQISEHFQFVRHQHEQFLHALGEQFIHGKSQPSLEG